MDRANRFAAVILSGGLNTRVYGQDKAFLRVLGIPMIDRILSILRPLFDELIIVTNKPDAYENIVGATITRDVYPGSGPLGGLHAAMKVAESDALFLVSADMPFLSPELIREQLKEYRPGEILIPVSGKHPEPLHSLIDKGCFDQLESYLSTDTERKLVDFLFMYPHRLWEPEVSHIFPNPFTNINSFGELEKTGIRGYVRIIQANTEIDEDDLVIAAETGRMLASSGWGMCAGDESAIVLKVLECMTEAGGISKIIFSDGAKNHPKHFWPLKEGISGLEDADEILDRISEFTIMIGSSPKSELSMGKSIFTSKPIVWIHGSGQMISGPLPGIFKVQDAREAIRIINGIQSKQT